MSTISPPAPVGRKSRRRWYIAGSFLLLLVATPVGYYFIAGWLRDRELAAIYREIEADDPHWRWPDLVAQFPEPPPDDQNAAVQVLKVRDLLKKTPFNVPVTPAKKKKTADPRNARLSEAKEKALRDAFSRLTPDVVEEARKLKDLPQGRFRIVPVENPLDPVNGAVIDREILDVMRLLHHDASLRGQDGKTEEAAESCQALLHMCHAINDAPGLLTLLIRNAGRDLAVDAIERTLGQGTIAQKRLQVLQDALVLEAEFNALYHALRGERATSHQLDVLVREGKTTYSEMYGGMGFKRPVPDRVFDMFPSLFVGDSAENLRLNNERVQASKLPDAEQLAAFRAVEQKALKSRDNLLRVVATIITNVAEDDQIAKAKLRCAITAVAAERYRLANGRWPGAADDLVKAGLLKESYKDPYDGKPLRWKRTTTGVIIYSVGPDLIDNDGKLDRDNARAPGTDLGFELWLPKFRAAAAPADNQP